MGVALSAVLSAVKRLKWNGLIVRALIRDDLGVPLTAAEKST